MTRLLREHPRIDVELDTDGRLVAIRWNGRREAVEVCNRWRVEESWWRDPIARDYARSWENAGSRSSTRTGSPVPGTSSGSMTKGRDPSLSAAARRDPG